MVRSRVIAAHSCVASLKPPSFGLQVQSFLSLGHLHIPIYGLFAAVGLMCAMALGQRTAVFARVDRDALWDTEMFTVLAAFVLSRGLLVIENLPTFLHYPILVLELPSLTLGGVVATAIFAAFYIHRKQLPLLNVLDALAPCGALLWVFLNLGQVADGTREGMPSTVPWAISSSFGRVHPVEVYSAVAWLVLCGVLLWILKRAPTPGETGAWGMVLGGLLQFGMCFFRLPQMLYGTSIIDGGQLRALQLTVAGGLLLAWCMGIGARRPASPTDVANAV